MKEATGELNMTVVTVVAIAAVAAFFYAFIWPGIQSNIKASTYCSNANCPNSGSGDFTNCSYLDENNETQTGLNCTNYFRNNQ